MSRERAPVMQRVQTRIDSMRSAVQRTTHIKPGEAPEVFGSRLKDVFNRGLAIMARKQHQWLHGTSKYRKPHQGPKECARRAQQLESGAIWNYYRPTHYMNRSLYR